MIDTLRQKTEDVISLFQSALTMVEELEKKNNLLDKRANELYAFKKEQEDLQTGIAFQKEEIKKEKAYIEEKNREIREKALLVQSYKKYLEDIKEEEDNLAVRREEAIKRERIADEKIAKFTDLAKKEKELLEIESRIEKEKEIDRERKRILDLRAEKIKLRERALQMDIENAEI